MRQHVHGTLATCHLFFTAPTTLPRFPCCSDANRGVRGCSKSTANNPTHGQTSKVKFDILYSRSLDDSSTFSWKCFAGKGSSEFRPFWCLSITQELGSTRSRRNAFSRHLSTFACVSIWRGTPRPAQSDALVRDPTRGADVVIPRRWSWTPRCGLDGFPPSPRTGPTRSRFATPASRDVSREALRKS